MRRGPKALALPLVAATLSAWVLGGCPSSAQNLLERADELERDHKYQQAQTAYRDALRRLGDDDSAPARELRTRGLAHLADVCYLDLRDLRCAADSYRRLIENYPEAPETFAARTHLAEMLRDRLSDVPGAIAQYKALASAYPGRAGSDDFQYQVAEGYFTLHDYVQARSEAHVLLERFEGSARAPQARFLIASCYELEGQRPEATKAFEDLLTRDPEGELASKARVALAKLLEQQGEREKALQLLKQGIPDPTEAAFIAEERRRLTRDLAQQKPLSRQAIFGEHGGGDGEGGGRHRGSLVGLPAETGRANEKVTGKDPYESEGDSQ